MFMKTRELCHFVP